MKIYEHSRRISAGYLSKDYGDHLQRRISIDECDTPREDFISSFFSLPIIVLLLYDEESLHKLVVHRPCSRLEIRESVLLLIVLCHIALRELSMNSDDRINRRLKILESDASLFIIGQRLPSSRKFIFPISSSSLPSLTSLALSSRVEEILLSTVDLEI